MAINTNFVLFTQHPSRPSVVDGCLKKPPAFHNYSDTLFCYFDTFLSRMVVPVENSKNNNEVLDMQLDITGHQLDVTEPIKDYIDTKFERIKRHSDQVLSVHVILSVEKIRHKSEATMHIGGKDFFAESTEDHLYKSIDSMVDKLDKQIRRHKGKLNNYNNKEAIAINRTQY